MNYPLAVYKSLAKEFKKKKWVESVCIKEEITEYMDDKKNPKKAINIFIPTTFELKNREDWEKFVDSVEDTCNKVITDYKLDKEIGAYIGIELQINDEDFQLRVHASCPEKDDEKATFLSEVFGCTMTKKKVAEYESWSCATKK